MDTQIQPIRPEGWTKVDGIQPVKDDVLVEILYGSVNPSGSLAGLFFTAVYAKEVDWNGKTIESPNYWRRFNAGEK